MRLFEIVAPPLYLASNSPLSSGDLIEGPSPRNVSSEIESALSRTQPDGCVDREEALRLYESPSLDAEYVYAVRPLGHFDRHHTSWLTKLRSCNLANEGEKHHYASGYWSGEIIPEDRDAPWEYLAAKVTVLRRVGGKAPAGRPKPPQEINPLVR